MKRISVCLFGMLAALLEGCATTRPSAAVLAQAGGNAALFNQFAAYDTRSGARLSLGELVPRLASAHVVFFGEEHGNVVCNQLQAQLTDALQAHYPPQALAMEFLEADTQAALDAYLDGKLDETEFIRQARQGRGYWVSHRPLIERSRAAGSAVLAANAPRRLVRAFRVSELEYDAFLESVRPEDRRWIPSRSERLGGAYKERFYELMGGHEDEPAAPESSPAATEPAPVPMSVPATAPAEPSNAPADTQPTTQAAPESQPTAARTQPAEPATQPVEHESRRAEPAPGSSVERFYRSQLMWDDAMAESIANYRKRHSRERVMLIVGSFHVAREGGTVQKYRERRPRDRTLTVVFIGTQDGRFPLRAEDRDAADIVIYGITPPPEPKEGE